MSAAAAESGVQAGEINRCLVYCRLRPSKPQDYEDGAFKLLHLHNKRVAVQDERNYDFDGTFDEDSKQEDVFESIARPCLDHAFKGFTSAILAYGQTGTGKTFTMVALHKGSQGIIPRSAQYIFDKVAADQTRTYTITAQFVQIYRDQLGDLLVEGGKEKVDIRYEKDEGVTLPGCVTTELNSAQHFMDYFTEGDKRRVVMATAMNPESSRGHTALVVQIKSRTRDESSSSSTVHGKITFIDLAGYERFSKTGISNSDPIRKDEAKTINASLLALGHVVTALSNNDKHIPWRNSKLTRLLQDSIGGRSRTTIVLTVGPSSEHLHESTNTLQFGLRAMAVKVQAKISSIVDYEKLAAKLQQLLDEKDRQISSLELKLVESNAAREELQQRHSRDEDELRARQQEQLEELKTSGASAEKILEVNSLFEVELENLKEQQREELSYQQDQADEELKVLMEEQAKNSRRKEDEARAREESRLKELEEKLAQARGGDSTADLERCLKQLAERDAVLVSRAGERARLQALCATLIQQVRQLGGTPISGGDFEENYMDVVQVEELRSMLEIEIEGLKNQASDLRIQLGRIQEVASNRANEVEELRDQVDQLHQQQHSDATAAAAAAAAVQQQQQEQQQPAPETSAESGDEATGENNNDNNLNDSIALDTASAPAADNVNGFKIPAIGGFGRITSDGSAFSLPSPGQQHHPMLTARSSNMVDKSEIETVRTLMQIDIDMLNTKVRMLEQQLSAAEKQLDAAGLTSVLHVGSAETNNNNNNNDPLTNQSFNSNNAAYEAPLTARGSRRRGMSIRMNNNNNNNNNGPTSGDISPSTGGGGNIYAPTHIGGVDIGELKRELNELRSKNVNFESTNVALQQHVKYLEELVDDLGGSAMPAPPQETVGSIENVVKTAHQISKAKTEELERLLALLEAREAVVNEQAMQIATLSEDSRRIREQHPEVMRDLHASKFADGGAQDTSPVQLMTQQHSTQVKNFVEMIRAARTAQRAAEEKFYALQAKAASMKLNHIMDGESNLDSSFSGLLNNRKEHHHADPSDHNNENVDFGSLIRQNDDKLLQAEARVIELETQNTSLKRMVAALEKQLEIADMRPVCGLSKEDREFVDLEREKDNSQTRAAQAELEAQLHAQLEEKKKIQSMLDEMSKKRSQEAAVFTSMESKLEEQKAEIQKKVEEDRKNSTTEMLKLQKIADEHAAEAKRLKEKLEERERKEREASEEAERVKKQLEELAKQQKAGQDEATRLKAELEEKNKASSEKESEAERLKRQLAENTSAMMAEQAKKQLAALGEPEKKPSGGGFFDRFKSWKL